MAAIEFTVTHDFDVTAQVLWDEMVDWESHSAWIPATTVEVDPGDPVAVGATFTGITGYGPLKLVDPMVITVIDWNQATGRGECEVEKLGPMLVGQAGFVVESTTTGSRIEWFERVTVRYLPRFLSPLVSKAGALGFSFAMKRLAKVIEARLAAAPR